MDNFSLAKENMIKGQILPNKIIDKALIQSLCDIPRHNFIPEKQKFLAYSDELIDISHNRVLLSPMLLAKMIQAAGVNANDSVLDIACASGYSSAVLARLTKKVVAIESDPDLASKANFVLNKLDIGNVIVLNGKLSEGHPDGAPYDVILINGSLESKPFELIRQLSETGRLVAIIKNEVILLRKINGEIAVEYICDADVPLMSGFENDYSAVL